MKNLVFKAPAKINLGLNIVSKRSDGFHNLETFFYPIKALCDILIFEESNSFKFTSNNSNLNKEPDNLILKAHSLIENFIGKQLPVKITLTKNIPIGAGLGGGSSDAATTLIALNKFFNLKIEPIKLNQFALNLGSDVPFFLKSKPQIGYSRGEILYESQIKITHPILIVNPGIHISTKEAFSNITPKPSKFDYNYFITSKKIDFNQLNGKLTNDFEKYVFDSYPEILEIKQTLLKHGAIFSQMSGTGSTVYGIFNNIKNANDVLEKLPVKYFKFLSNIP